MLCTEHSRRVSWDLRPSQANPQAWDAQLPYHLMPCFTFIIWEKWISMDRHGSPMSDMIQHRTFTVESPGLSSPPHLSLHLQALSCAFSPLPYPRIPSVAQNILKVTNMESRWRCSHIERNPTCSTHQTMSAAHALASPQTLPAMSFYPSDDISGTVFQCII